MNAPVVAPALDWQGLKGRQRELVEFVCKWQQEHGGHGPTLRQIAAGMGYASHGTVAFHLDPLREAGFIESTESDFGVTLAGGEWLPPAGFDPLPF